VNRLAQGLERIRADLAARGRSFALVGGIAASIRAEPRLTRDVDVAVTVAGDRDAEDLCKDLLTSGYRIAAQVEQEATGRLATVRLEVISEDAKGLIVDLIFASCGIEPEVVAAAEEVEVVPGVRVPVARREHLIAMKLLARDDRRRPQDRDDLAGLVRRASPPELQAARDAMRLIGARGFARGRDLVSSFDALLSELGSAP
jgi:hypothetical protein